MRTEWWIQTNMDGVDTSKMIAEVRDQGMPVTEINHKTGQQILFDDGHSINRVICYGDIDFIRQIRRHAPFVPGAYCSFDNMKCSTYYAWFKKWFLQVERG